MTLTLANQSTLETVSQSQYLRASDIKARVQLIQEVMHSVMQEGQHYGKIPGLEDKPTLLKAGAEKILMAFRISIDPVIDDLSTTDEIRYRVTARSLGTSGEFLGAGIGEASSSEEKYKWRRAICEEEWLETKEDRRREKWARGKTGNYKIKQIRTSPADVANTILKMAKKRAMVDAALTVTAASDIFAQDLEDMPDELKEIKKQPVNIEQPKRKSEVTQRDTNEDNSSFISEAQRKRLFTITKNYDIKDEQIKQYLQEKYGINSTSQIRKADYDDICNWVETAKLVDELEAAGI